MADTVLLYISTAADLAPEREVLGRAVTELPVTLGWRVVQTPRADESLDLAAAAQADVHLLLLGSDIRAPVGLEWIAARRAGCSTVFFLKKGASRTPAAQAFAHEVERQTSWRLFEDAADLRRQVLARLAGHLLARAEYYVLRPAEFEALRAWRDALEKAEPRPPDETRGGAGDSAVILSPERFTPSDGVVITSPGTPA
ncbi:MAG: hypothetical protein M5U01_42320 [Ardenticatenaceae bacterium]|nr:hypothetical protein [Ardenticatenaceae bacterium]HBY97184.1 hypothetical protein [Chloroflexota bacterium]